jgi:hypothetical protein
MSLGAGRPGSSVSLGEVMPLIGCSLELLFSHRTMFFSPNILA